MKFIDPNIVRKGKLISSQSNSQREGGASPIFALVEFNLSGRCTRQCIFCPRSDKKKFPNTNESISVDLYKKIMSDLKKVDFAGTILYSAFSEPLLYKNLEEIIKISKHYCPKARIEIVSNGDLATKARIADLFRAGLTVLSISMYDGPQQRTHFEKIQKELGLSAEQFILRVRWLPAEENFGITLSNRAGMIEIKGTNTLKLKEPMKSACYYPFYQTFIDCDGSVLLCPHDWGKKMILGNVKERSLLEIWDNEFAKKARIKLSKNNRKFSPCDVCDVTGTLMGRQYFDKWLNYYAKQQSIKR
jgi:radical SAM protein with 4Fe4S-binding SPASM domain